MAYVSYKSLGESESDNNVSKENKLEFLNTNQIKLEVHDIYEKDERKQQTLKMLLMKM